MTPRIARPYLDLFLISFLILFFELAAIRWFASTVVFLTFFTNIVLLACFLGMSIGLLATRRPQSLGRTVLPLALIAFALAVLVHLAYWQWADTVTVGVGNQQTSPELIFFGTEGRPADPSRWVVPMWAIASAFFLAIALTFVGLGQTMGRAFDAIPDRVKAYSIDVIGSLAGIAAFAVMSYLQLPPTVWFVPILLLALYFAGWRRPVQVAAAIASYVVIAIGAHGLLVHGAVYWSPYYKVGYMRELQVISTNDIGHQQMLPIGRFGSVYVLPHLLNRDSGGRPFKDQVIIGAGSGNDVAAALRFGVNRIDAVEIDPRIQLLGRLYHPDQPYRDPRVTVRLDDGRSFLRTTDRRYDLAVYALVDSLVLHSGYSSLRLENFLFTREAFRDVKARLKPDGLFVMYNYYRQGWVVERLVTMAEEVFGEKPIVISLPYSETIDADDNQRGRITFLIAGAHSSRLDALRERFAKEQSFWVNALMKLNEPINGFGATPPAGDGWLRIAPVRGGLQDADRVPTDDWPQLYLRRPEIPWAPIGQGMVGMAVVAFALLLAFAPRRQGVRFNGQMFFLGAGFMLLETKGVVHMALLFGSTWVVNSIVFMAILVMILAANLFVIAAAPRRGHLLYGLLIGSLLVNTLVPMNAFLSLPGAARVVVSCLVVFVPLFFAGVAFAAAFRESTQPDIDLGCNIAGIIVGGLSEQLSLIFGFDHLLLVAIAYYLLSFALRRRDGVVYRAAPRST